MYESVAPVRIVGRYALYGELAAGGMATVHLGRLLGPVGFSRTVAIKRLHEQFAKDPEFVSMFLDEARLCARIRHPNVVPTLDVIAEDRQLLLVMEYVQGESLSRLFRAAIARGERVPLKIVVAILSGVLHGLHAAHEAKDERGQPLGIVHRDVSPQNVLVGSDGVARVLDFGVAKAKGRIYTTQDGRVKGKLSYMAPEQLRSDPVDRKSDIFAASIMTWELLTGQRLFEAENEGATVTKLLLDAIPTPSSIVKPAPERESPWPALDAIVMRGLERDPSRRFATARDMANQLEEAVQAASAGQVGTWVETVASEVLTARSARVQDIESCSSDLGRPLSEMITNLTSDADVTKTQELSSPSRTIVPPAPPTSASELVSKAHMPVSTSKPIHIERDPWAKRATFVLIAMAVGGLFWAMRSGHDTTSRSAAATSVKGEAPEVAPPALAVERAPSLPEVTAPLQESPASTSGSTTPDAAPPVSRPTPSSVSSAPSARPARPSPKPAPKPATSVDCRDPYTRDPLGRKIYKIECL